MTHRLLAINFGGIGDEILFLPVLASIKKAFPNWHITLLVEPRSQAIKDITNLIDDIETFDIKKQPLKPQDYLDLCSILQRGNYHTVISSGSSPLVSCLLFMSGIKERIGYDSGFLSRMLLTSAVKLNKDQYAADMYHDLVRGLGLPVKLVVPKIEVPLANKSAMQNLLGTKPYKILIHPGVSKMAVKKGIIKTWSAINWATLISKLLQDSDAEIILAGGPDDEQTINEINQALKKEKLSTESDAFISVYGKTTSLADLAGLMAIANLLICVDSAPMHMAVGLNRPLLAIFGPTKPERLLPRLPNFNFMINPSPGEILPVVLNLLPKTISQ